MGFAFAMLMTAWMASTRAWLEGDVLQTESLNVLLGDLDGWNTSSNGQTLDWNTLGT